MSPRSAELLALARRRLAQARLELDGGFHDGAISSAYYAMLSAARAALSERDLQPRSHGGTWGLFREQFVASGQVEQEVFVQGPRLQNLRWAADYEGEEFTSDEAEAALDSAARFVAAVERAFA